MKLTEEEIAVLTGIRDTWIAHAEACDRMANRKMADWQKQQDLLKVSALNKVLAYHSSPNPHDSH